MPSFWEHYAQANDDIRHQLIDRGWFQDRMARNSAMQDGLKDPNSAQDEEVQTEDLYGTVQSQDPNMPDALQQSGMKEGTEQNLQATKDAVEEFYGVRERPNSTELGGDAEEERRLAEQERALTPRL